MEPTEPENAADDNGSGRPPKRQRVSRACAPCRYAKLRCNGQQPACSTCQQQKKSCTYETVSKRRGLRSGYVRALELLWGLTFQELENAESVVDILLGRLSKQDVFSSPDRAELNPAASTLLDRWKQSDISRHLDDLLDDNEESNDEAGARTSQDEPEYLRPDRTPGWIVKRHPKDDGGSIALDLVNPVINPQVDIWSYQQVPDTHHKPEVQPPSYAPQLLQLFLSQAQSWLPILERHVLLKTSFLSQRNLSSTPSGDRAALWGVYAYASAMYGHLLDDASATQHAEIHCDSFYAQAYSMLPLDTDVPLEIGYIQCALLLSLTRFGSGALRASWRLVRLASQMMGEMTLQRGHHVEQDVFAKSWLACFILDTLTSACLQCEPTLHFNDVVNWCNIDHNGVEEWQPWHPPRSSDATSAHSGQPFNIPTHSLSLLTLHVKLLRILNDNLRARDPAAEISRVELARWDQELLSCLSHEGLTSAFQNQDWDILQLPPSFTSLSIIYTSLWEGTLRQPEDSRSDNSRLAQGIAYPLLSRTNLQKLSQDRKASKQLPTLQLFIRYGGMLGFDELTDKAASGSGHITEFSGGIDNRLPSLELPQIRPEPDSQRQTHHLFTNLNTNPNPNQPVHRDTESDSGFHSFDGCMDPAAAPFLEFLDTLDDRPIHDSDLFNKSLGFSF
ncbi:uncharacterized protein Z520_02663 [Fonsecaea multimorphosa CBS 102226]|uniref:Zn(2)-C6 fungal-type domain-containing protein n=1 Tax=Fonsecaea multimorphosa CBS 102226 TaxID=1442371 RepID=A0A0D2HGR7_9EURO|nr:uncharacterized protein Z520_02663 [Fonsecaea multimorphosa CBS 102226]KIY01111.1 hypothetical protein Z520_02663 [Fonsecaea multimorphosa CBS 102226]OAL28732.1 hypothetical protein AYO22_02597 [Fonsecaea multimorphosa]